MKLDLYRCPVVVVGAWNRAIFSPEWVQKRLFSEGERLQAEIGFLPPLLQYSTDLVALSIDGPQLRVVPLKASNDAFEEAERVALAVLEKLGETPLAGMGVNFGFDVSAPTEMLRQLLEHADRAALQHLGAELISSSLTRTFSLEGRTLNLIITKNDGPWRLDFNHHTALSTAEEARERMRRLGDCKIEVCAGRLFVDEFQRRMVLGMLLENVGLDAAIELAGPGLWRQALSAKLLR